MHAPASPARIVALLLLLVAVTLSCAFSGCRKAAAGSADPASAATQASVQAQLRALQSAQNAYMARHDHYACTMAELGSQFGLIDRQLASGHKDGYIYDIQCSANENPSYQVWASPINNGLMSPASYCVDQTGQLHSASHRLDTCSAGSAVE
jgi:hypothetical protein